MSNFGKYEILEEIGRGGFAVVYKARDTTLDRIVALKVLHARLADDPKFLQRFKQEAQTVSRLHHPHIATVYEVGEEAGQYYLAMVFLPGQTLDERMSAGLLAPEQALSIVEQIASALDTIHERGLVHRDVKPSNVIVDDKGQVTLVDFGIVRAAEGTKLTTTMAVLGTPEYMSPEQADGEKPDHRSDLYALGIMTYQMCTGQVPFSAPSPLAVLRGHVDKEAPAPRKLNPSLSLEVEQVLLKALAKQREARYQSAGEMAQALREALEPKLQLHPRLTLKLSTRPQRVAVGAKVKWTVTLRNDGDDTLRRVIVRRGRTLLAEPFDLAAGQGRRFTFGTTHETQGKKTRKVTAAGTASNGDTVRDEASAIVQVRQPVKQEPTARRETAGRAKKESHAPFSTRQPFEPEMILIPAGEFLMGSDPQKDERAREEEQPQHTLYLPDYYLARTPATNAQYAVFVGASGHKPPRHWKDDRPPDGKENYPVAHVTWYDAIVYCRWLSEATGRSYGLPSEAQWEKGARGGDGRIYPWGNQWDAKRCNSAEGFLATMRDIFSDKKTTPVDAYPQGASPYGLLDMAGNVWEWTTSAHKDYPYDQADGRENLEGGDQVHRVLRGAAFYLDARFVRCAYRDWSHPRDRNYYLGFRVVVVAAPFSPRSAL